MSLLKFVAWVWIGLLIIFTLLFILGIIIEQKIDESHPIKKWWRKHIIAPDPYDNDWKNFDF